MITITLTGCEILESGQVGVSFGVTDGATTQTHRFALDREIKKADLNPLTIKREIKKYLQELQPKKRQIISAIVPDYSENLKMPGVK